MKKPSDSSGNDEPSTSIPVVEESVILDKKILETGTVKVVKQVSHQEVEVNESILQEEVTVERVPIDRFVDQAPPATRQEGEVTIVPVLKEVIVKKLLLVEELHIRKVQRMTQEPQKYTLRAEEVDVLRHEKSAQ